MGGLIVKTFIKVVIACSVIALANQTAAKQSLDPAINMSLLMSIVL